MKRFLCAIGAAAAAVCVSLSAAAISDVPIEDPADLLTAAAEEELSSELEQFSLDYGLDAVIVTTDDLDGMTPERYSRDKFDELNCGIGGDKDGVMLLIAVNSSGGGEVYFRTSGWARKGVFDDYCTDRINGLIAPELKKGDYAGACTEWIKLCGKFASAAEKGKPYTAEHRYKSGGDYLLGVLISFGAGLLIALVVCFIMRGTMKTAVPKPYANDYVKPNSFRVTKQRDIFIYSKVEKRVIEEKKTDSGTERSGGSGKSF